MLTELYRYETFDDLQTKAEEFTENSTIPGAPSAQYKGSFFLFSLGNMKEFFSFENLGDSSQAMSVMCVKG